MQELIDIYLAKQKRLKSLPMRDFTQTIEWSDRLIGIKGARGVGKTTLMLQKLKTLNLPPQKAMYVSLDDLWFSQHRFIDFVRQYVLQGGEFLFVDEVHKYENWSQEFKNSYDTWSELNVVFTGSSMLHIHDSRADLSRRAMMYHLHGFSFREYVNVVLGTNFKAFSLDEILTHHQVIAQELTQQFKPLSVFSEYLKQGFYPYGLESKNTYLARLKETVLYVLEVDLVQLRNISVAHIHQLKKLLYVLSHQVPFKPNTVQLAELIGVARNTLLGYLNYLDEAELITQLYCEGRGDKLLQKPDKVYLQNPNLMHALGGSNVNVGKIRETFFINQLSTVHKVNYADKGDFLVDDTWLFEVGGHKKTFRQIANEPNSFLAVDDVEIGFGNRIPLWLLGFLS